jgi:hypothetical protein
MTPFFLQNPTGFENLMGTVLDGHLKLCEEMKAEPDLELVGPASQMFEQLKNQHPASHPNQALFSQQRSLGCLQRIGTRSGTAVVGARCSEGPQSALSVKMCKLQHRSKTPYSRRSCPTSTLCCGFRVAATRAQCRICTVAMTALRDKPSDL